MGISEQELQASNDWLVRQIDRLTDVMVANARQTQILVDAFSDIREKLIALENEVNPHADDDA